MLKKLKNSNSDNTQFQNLKSLLVRTTWHLDNRWDVLWTVICKVFFFFASEVPMHSEESRVSFNGLFILFQMWLAMLRTNNWVLSCLKYFLPGWMKVEKYGDFYQRIPYCAVRGSVIIYATQVHWTIYRSKFTI